MNSKRTLPIWLAVLMACAISVAGCSPAAPATSETAPTAASVPVAGEGTAKSTTMVAFEGPTLKAIRERGVLRVGLSADFPPMEFIDPDKPDVPIGFDVDFANEIGRRLGVKTEIVNTAFDGIFPALLGDKFDMVISGLTIRDSREETVDMIPYYATGPVIMVSKGNPKNIHSLDDLSGVRAGAQIGAIGYDFFQEADMNLKAAGKEGLASLQAFNQLTDVVDQMRLGRIDAIIADYPTLTYFSSKAPGTFEIVPGVLEENLNGIAVRPDSSDLRIAVSWIIVQMQLDGSYDAIYSKWLTPK